MRSGCAIRQSPSAFRLGLRTAGLVAGTCAAILLAACAQQGRSPAVSQGTAENQDSSDAANAQTTDAIFESASTTAGDYLSGLHAERMGDVSVATKFLLQALSDDPDSLELLQRTFLLTLSEGRVAKAMNLARRLNKVSPDAPLPALALGVLDFKNGHYKSAAARFAKLPDVGLNKFVVPLLTAWTDAGAGKMDKALDDLDPLAQNSAFVVVREMHAGFIDELAGKTKAAEVNYRAALDAGQGGAVRIVQALGRLYERTGQPDKAKALYDGYVKENPDTVLLDLDYKRLKTGAPATPLIKNATDGMAEALFNVAGTLEQQNVGLIALTYARLALMLKPDYPVCQALVADIYEAEGRDAEAITIYAGIDKNTPFYWLGRLHEAVYLNTVDKTDLAVAKLNEMAKERPDRIDMLVTLGDILRAKEKFNEADDAYTRALDRIPKLEERDWAILYARGIVRERANKWKLAEADFLEALKLRPDQPYVLNYLAYSWVEKGIHLERARSMLERAYELRPNDGFIVDSMGWILLRLGQVKEAVEKLELAVELEPSDATINDHLGDAYWRAGRFAEARYQWRRALALKPDPEAIPKIEAKLHKGLAVSRAESPGT